ncbi:MAG: hypothetical protein KAI66_07280 [Lentisphaeria bacterium]|nr:hypothetical protein [Lentisphaeria bacterium]
MYSCSLADLPRNGEHPQFCGRHQPARGLDDHRLPGLLLPLGRSHAGPFPPEEYEKAIKAVARASFGKIYLRVDVCGKTLYPSVAGVQYRGDGRDPGSQCLVDTLELYDPAAKTIELGHKYGLEVWCWDTLFDDEATMVRYPPGSDLAKKYGEYPLKDPFLVRNPHLQWRLSPRVDRQQRKTWARLAAHGPVTKLRVTSDRGDATSRVRDADVQILVSDDNVNYRALDAFQMSIVQQKPPILLFEGFSVVQPYFKLALAKNYPKDDSFTICGDRKDFVQMFCDGEWVSAVADWRKQREPAEQGGFGFTANGRFAWDYSNRALGVATVPCKLPKYYGMIELAWPEARAHKLAKLRELAKYAFDGFAYSMRTHTGGLDPAEYGYGKPVREAYQKEHGVDIWTEEFDQEKWLALRASFVNQYLRQAVSLLGERPLYMDVPRMGAGYTRAYGGVPFQPAKWPVAGIRLMGFPEDQPLPALLARAKTKKVRFVDNWTIPPIATFAARLRRSLNEPQIDEVEFYETILYTLRPQYLEAVRNEVQRRKP